MKHTFSREVKESISFSREEALRLGSTFIGPEHLLLGLLRQADNAAFYVLKCMPVDILELTVNLEKEVQGKDSLFKDQGQAEVKAKDVQKRFLGLRKSDRSVALTRQAESVIRDSVDIAESFTSREVEPEYLMLSLLKVKENGAASLLQEMGVDYGRFLQELG